MVVQGIHACWTSLNHDLLFVLARALSSVPQAILKCEEAFVVAIVANAGVFFPYMWQFPASTALREVRN